MLGDLPADQIEALLHSATVGRIGCLLDGRPYVVPVRYAYEGGNVYVHSGEGAKIHAMRAHPEVCFEVEALEDDGGWRSVIAWGEYEELREDAAAHAMALLLRRQLAAGTAAPNEGASHSGDVVGRGELVFRIVLGERTGRFDRP